MSAFLVPTREHRQALFRELRDMKEYSELEAAVEKAGIPYERYQTWMRVGDLMHTALHGEEPVYFVSDHVRRVPVTRFYRDVLKRLFRFHGARPPPPTYGPQVLFGKDVEEEFAYFLGERYWVSRACAVVGVSPRIFWNWFRKGRLKSERYRRFYENTRAVFVEKYTLEEATGDGC